MNDAGTETVGSKLLSEIERVSAKRERWRQFEEMPAFKMANFGPAILLMTRAIDQAKAALQSDNVADSISALRALEGYSNED